MPLTGTKISLVSLQQLVFGTHPEPAESSPQHHILYLLDLVQ